jgi:hypothetical protein
MERFATPPSETATDYEAMVYLHTASLATPLSREMTNVYSYLFSKYHTGQAKKIDVYMDKITETEERELSRLKKWIFQKQMKSKQGADCMGRYVIELSKSLSNGMEQCLANETQRPINEITKHDVANGLFDVILAEIDWNLKYKLPEGTSWEFYVTPQPTHKPKEVDLR